MEVLRALPCYGTSGGEPLMQPDFARAILERCQAEGIHTAVETCGNCRWQDIEMLLPAAEGDTGDRSLRASSGTDAHAAQRQYPAS